MADTPLRQDDPGATTATPGTQRVPADEWVYMAIVVPYDDAPDECTIFPAGLSEDELTTTWLSAEEGSFVSLAEMA